MWPESCVPLLLSYPLPSGQILIHVQLGNDPAITSPVVGLGPPGVRRPGWDNSHGIGDVPEGLTGR
jgi:hypothetical protein